MRCFRFFEAPSLCSGDNQPGLSPAVRPILSRLYAEPASSGDRVRHCIDNRLSNDWLCLDTLVTNTPTFPGVFRGVPVYKAGWMLFPSICHSLLRHDPWPRSG